MCIIVFTKEHFFSPKLSFVLPMITKLRLSGFQNKSSFDKLALIIYTNAARITIDHIGPFKSASLNFFFIRDLQIEF